MKKRFSYKNARSIKVICEVSRQFADIRSVICDAVHFFKMLKKFIIFAFVTEVLRMLRFRDSGVFKLRTLPVIGIKYYLRSANLTS